MRTLLVLLASALLAFGLLARATEDPAPVEVASSESPESPGLSPRTVRYDIDVAFDPEMSSLISTQTMTWRNDTGAPVEEVYLHLYLNAFRNSRSTFMTESGGAMRGKEMKDDKWGFVEIETISRADDGTALLDGLEFIQPDDGNPHDRTLARLRLDRPVEPGATLELDLDVTAKLPYPFARTGSIEGYAMVGQWFPKFAKWDDRGGWNLHQFHAQSEFFADFGVYDVCVTLPSDHVVGATGVEVSREAREDGTTTHCYHAEDVHDFAWTASPEFVEFTGSSQDVAIRALVHRDKAALGQRHVDAAAKSVAWFQDHVGDYPFPNLTVVDPKVGAEGSGGMEYPTLITAGSKYRQSAGDRSLEHVIHHEFGHNFWYHLLASNEFEESWLDEGVNTYTDIRGMEDLYGPMLEFGDIEIDYKSAARAAVVLRNTLDPIRTRAWEFSSEGSYGVNSYMKPGAVLETLRGVVGPEAFDQALRDYVARWRFRHPKTEDFIASFEQSLGRDLSDFFHQALETTARVDFAIGRVRSKEVEDKGYGFDLEIAEAFSGEDGTGDQGPGTEEEEGTGDEEEGTRDQGPGTGELEEEEEREEPKRYRNVVVVERRGDFRVPTEVVIHLDDGSERREPIDGQRRWWRFDWEDERQVVSAEVDPQRLLLLDVDFSNNSRVREPEHSGIDRVSARAVFLAQNLLELIGL